MKKYFILVLLFSIFYVNKSYSQDADIIHKPNHIFDDSNLKDLIDQVGSVASFSVPNIQLQTNYNQIQPGHDLYTNVYIKLFYENVDVNSAALLEEVKLPISINIIWNNSSVQRILTDELNISPLKDKAVILRHFSLDELYPHNLSAINDVEVTFNDNEVSYIDPQVLNNLILEIYVEIGKYEFEPISIIHPTYNEYIPNGEIKKNEIMIVWEDIAQKPSYYELEWIYVGNDKLIGPDALSIDFSSANRIQTKSNFYSISMVFDNGYLVSRIRAVRPQINEDKTMLTSKLEYGPWSIPNSDSYVDLTPSNSTEVDKFNSVLNLNSPDFDFLDNFNWQYTSTYSSEGKKKEIINFFDGSNRNRQTVTFLNDYNTSRSFSDKMARPLSVAHNSTLIVKEDYYDFNGQASLNILPAPLPDASSFIYQSNINTLSNSKIEANDFDGNAVTSPFAMDNTSPGASRYYSSNNVNVGQGKSKFIPDAAGYPYVRKEYLNDGSGRLKAEYGAGDGIANDIGGLKNTRYFYTTPTNSELEILFGTNVGENLFYKKNIIVDANGVISMAYIDQKDRTIATSIAGSAKGASKMTDIPGSNARQFTENLLSSGKEKFIESTNSYELQYPIFVPEGGDYIFNYDLDVNSFVSCFNMTGNLCFTCDYDFTFKIIDDEGNVVIDKGIETVGLTPMHCDPEQFQLDYNGGSELVVSLSSQKQYTIIKKLSLNTSNLDSYVVSNEQSSQCARYNEEHFIQEELNAMDFTPCKTEFEDPCSFVRNKMIEDFIYPSGAFVENAPLDAEIVEYILMRTRREVSCSDAPTVSGLTQSPQTQDEIEERAYREGVKQSFLDQFGLDVQPTFAEFNSDYIEFFLDYHPSYCKLNACEILNSPTSRAFDNVLNESTTLADFVSTANSLSTDHTTSHFPWTHPHWTHVPPNADLTVDYNSSNSELNILSSFITQYVDHPRWIGSKYSSNFYFLDPDPNSVFPSILLQNDLALLSYDKALMDLCFPSLYSGPDLSAQAELPKKIGMFEIQQFPMSRQCYFKDINNDLWGVGTYKSGLDYFYLLLGYFADFNGCTDQQQMGITETSLNATDPNIISNYQTSVEWWTVYKTLYASAKRNFIKDVIDLSACVPKDHNYSTSQWNDSKFLNTDPNEGVAISSNDPGYGEGYGGSWHWDRLYDWGKWWDNATDCNIYLGDEPKDGEFHDVDGPSFVMPTQSDVNDQILDDLLSLIKGSWDDALCLADTANLLDITIVNSFSGKTFVESTNPFSYLGNYLPNCNVYTLNLSTVITPYLKYYKVTSSNGTTSNYFTKSRADNIKVNCYDLNQEIATVPNNIILPNLPNGKSDIDVTDQDQIAFKNWMNIRFGLNLSFEDYYDMRLSCEPGVAIGSAFNNPTSWNSFTNKERDLKEAVFNYGNLPNQYWTNINQSNLIATINTELSQFSSYSVSALNDYLSLGEVNYDNNHQYLFYLENEQTHFTELLDRLNAVFIALQTELSSTVPQGRKYKDFEDAFSAKARPIENVKGIVVNISNQANLTIDHAVLYSNGTIWVRLLDATGEVFVDDYYYHYQPHNQEADADMHYRLSTLTTTSFTGFTSIEPIFDQENIHYVWLKNAEYSLLASTSHEIATAFRLGKVELNEITGDGVLPFNQSCEDLKYEAARINGTVKYNKYLQELGDQFKHNYITYCTNRGSSNAFTQNLTMQYESKEHHFTLYYYDQADNLVMTVPPAGISNSFKKIESTGSITENLTYNTSLKQQIKNYRSGTSNNMIVPDHKFKTTYQYNADNQIIKQVTPNGGTTVFWYDKAGRLVMSQNAEQGLNMRFSYTLYDHQSRIVETGDAELTDFDNLYKNNGWDIVQQAIYNKNYNYPSLEDYFHTRNRNNVVKTYYDSKVLDPLPDGMVQENIRSRVATQAFFNSIGSGVNNHNWDYATHYSYDPVGNVKTVLNDYYQNGRLTDEEYRFKKLDYTFDPVSGNVLRVYYQLGEEDAFYHKYEYDAENRITSVHTSRDGAIWDNDATYDYYLHGPLARTELGEHKVQGIDYAYTLQGWLKAVNSGISGQDMGNDLSKNGIYGEDVFGYSLQYHDNDYSPIGTIPNLLLNHPNSTGVMANLYNGNIAAQSIHNKETTIGKNYMYDQLNRIKEMQEHNISGNVWGNPDSDDYQSMYSYDGNGNLSNLKRVDGDVGALVDNMDYHYISETDRLAYVSDNITTNYSGDFDGQQSGNYTYDAIGNLKSDVKEGITNIEWYPNGKIKRIVRNDPTSLKPNLLFQYDALGNRVKKEVSFVANGQYFIKSTYYVRDAQGNVMATYDERDCRFDNGAGADEDFYYQFSHNFEYYTNLAASQLPGGINDLINFLNSSSFPKKNELKNQAFLNINNIPDAKNYIWSFLDVEDYLTLYPVAKSRVINFKPHYFADYLYDNNFSAFLNIVNDRNEAYIQALKTNNLVSNFYSSFNTHFANYYPSHIQNSQASMFFNMNRLVLNSIITNNPTLFMNMLGLNSNQYSTVLFAYNNLEDSYNILKDLLDSLFDQLAGGEFNSEIEEQLKLINALLLVLNLNEEDIERLLDNIEIETFYEALQWLDPPYSTYLNSIMHHINVLHIMYRYDPPIEYGQLFVYKPMDAINWSADVNGQFLNYFLYTPMSNSGIFEVSEQYFVGFNMNNVNFYFVNGSTARNYVVQALGRNFSNPAILAALIHAQNISVTKDALYQTENLTHIFHYLKTHHPFELLLLNANHDGLLAALSGLINYSPLDYAKALEDHFSLNFDLLANCSTNNTYLVAESFEIYGSSRLGVMDANSKRSDDSNPNLYTRKLGGKIYELGDHLGNVVATVSDRKLHPQHLVTAGNPTVDPAIGFQAHVTGRYDRYPFGMEIASRSGDYSVIDYNQQTTDIIYEGLLYSCGDYSIVGGNLNCITSTHNLYNYQYVSTIAPTANYQNSFNLTAKMRLSQIIPNLDPEATYRIELDINSSGNRSISSNINTSETALVTSPSAGPSASSTQITAAADKLVSYEMSGAEIQALAISGKLNIKIMVGEGVGMFYSAGFNLNHVKVIQIFKNSWVPLARKKDKAYRYGFQGQEVDTEWDGVPFGGGDIPLWEDEIVARAIYNEGFDDLDNWNTPCAQLSSGSLLLSTGTNNCGAESHTIYVQNGKEYKLSVSAENLGTANLSIYWEYYDHTSSTWEEIITYSSSSPMINHKHVYDATSDQIRLRFSSPNASSQLFQAYVHQVLITEELTKWWSNGTQSNGVTPSMVNDNGRLKLQTNTQWGGAVSNPIVVNKIGSMHTLTFDAQIDNLSGTTVFLSMDQSNDGATWHFVGGKNWSTAPVPNQEYSFDFTPTMKYIRIYTSTWTETQYIQGITSVYFDNFHLSEGTTLPVVGGGLANKVAFKYRIHDVTIGRFLSLDPLFASYPELSPYAFSGNQVIHTTELEGLEPLDYLGIGDQKGFITSSTEGEYNNSSFSAGIKDGSYLLLSVMGLNALDNYISDLSEPDADKIDVTVNFAKGLLSPGKKGPIKGLNSTKPKLKTSNYSNLKDSKSVGPGKKFTSSQKAKILDANRKVNNGVLKSDMSGRTLDQPVQSKKGVPANKNQAEVDHINPKSKGGSNSFKNTQVLSKDENLKKGNK